MELSNQEISKLIGYADTFRNDCERQIRRIRRNIVMLNERFNEIPEEVALEDGVTSPESDIEYLKELKSESVIIKKKLALNKK